MQTQLTLMTSLGSRLVSKHEINTWGVTLSFSKWLVQPIQDRVHPRLRVLGSPGPNPGAEPKGPPGRSFEPGRPRDAGGDP